MFNQRNLTVGRGVFNALATPDGPAVHMYSPGSDTIDTVLAAGYFPAYLGFGVDFVKIHDSLVINTADNKSYSCIITSVYPFVLLALTQTVQRFPTLPTSGAYVGTVDVMFSKDALSKMVSFHFLKWMQITVNPGTLQLFNGGIPDPFKPNASILPIVESMLFYNVSSNGPFNAYCCIQNTGISFGSWTNAPPGSGNFGGAIIQIVNFTVNYLGT